VEQLSFENEFLKRQHEESLNQFDAQVNEIASRIEVLYAENQ
jgi:hypothetical protein